MKDIFFIRIISNDSLSIEYGHLVSTIVLHMVCIFIMTFMVPL